MTILHFPQDFADHEWEIKSKGWYPFTVVTDDGKRFRLNFYDRIRLNQEVEDELNNSGLFFEPNIIVISEVTRNEIHKALDVLTKSNNWPFIAES